MNNTRQRYILDIIAQEEISTQEQLLSCLQEKGISCTQATISRDIRKLNIHKIPTDHKTYRYAVQLVRTEDKLWTIFRKSITSVACAQNMVVLKTLPGMAGAACSALDSMNIRGILGSLAGDDTAFLVITNSAAAAKLCDEINMILHT